MTDLRKAAEIALERLTMWLEDFPDTAVIEDRWAVEALRQALAQPEQEPWLWIRKKYSFEGTWISNRLPDDPENWDAVYKAPQKPDVTLTDEGKTDKPCQCFKPDACNLHDRCMKAAP